MHFNQYLDSVPQKVKVKASSCEFSELGRALLCYDPRAPTIPQPSHSGVLEFNKVKGSYFVQCIKDENVVKDWWNLATTASRSRHRGGGKDIREPRSKLGRHIQNFRSKDYVKFRSAFPYETHFQTDEMAREAYETAKAYAIKHFKYHIGSDSISLKFYARHVMVPIALRRFLEDVCGLTKKAAERVQIRWFSVVAPHDRKIVSKIKKGQEPTEEDVGRMTDEFKFNEYWNTFY